MKKQVHHFFTLLQELQKIDAEFPLQYAICLAVITNEEGLSLTDLSQRTGMPLSTVSRAVGALGAKRQKGRPYHLVEVVVSMEERRKKQLYLTNRGRSLMNSIVNIIDYYDNERLHV